MHPIAIGSLRLGLSYLIEHTEMRHVTHACVHWRACVRQHGFMHVIN